VTPTAAEAGAVVDASALVALLADEGSAGRWVTETVGAGPLRAPALVDFEVANVLRRHELAGLIGADQAAQAHADLIELAIERWPYELLAARAWELRANLSIYDASYVAVAEFVHAPLVTLDTRVAGAPGIRCDVLTPSDQGAT
jgi:predicted nucleic acid-binding protein